MSTPFRIGAIPSLNALPLTAALREAPPAEVTVTWGAPSELAASLHRGDLDLALIPQVEVIDSPVIARLIVSISRISPTRITSAS